MSQEPRKASDVLLGLENSVSTLIKEVQSQNLLLKIISNKLSDLLNQKVVEPPKITVEAVNTQSLTQPIVSHVDLERNIMVSSEDKLGVDTSPQGFRRTSRPETFSGDNSYLNKAPPMRDPAIKYPTQIPRPNGGAEVIVVPDIATQNSGVIDAPQPPKKSNVSGASVPVKQRIVDGSGKSVFLADVEVFNLESNQSVSKTRTNGTGKWSTSLPYGTYKVVVKKRDSMSKEAKEVSQNLVVDGSSNQIEMPVMIIK